jgi:hypothetical protein
MWVNAKKREKNKEKHVNGAMFLTDSNARTLLKDSVLQLVPGYYRLKAAGTGPNAIQSNEKRVESLLIGLPFHSKVTRPYGNKLGTDSISTDHRGCPPPFRAPHHPCRHL